MPPILEPKRATVQWPERCLSILMGKWVCRRQAAGGVGRLFRMSSIPPLFMMLEKEGVPICTAMCGRSFFRFPWSLADNLAPFSVGTTQKVPGRGPHGPPRVKAHEKERGGWGPFLFYNRFLPAVRSIAHWHHRTVPPAPHCVGLSPRRGRVSNTFGRSALVQGVHSEKTCTAVVACSHTQIPGLRFCCWSRGVW